jgi:hypothetical protein
MPDGDLKSRESQPNPINRQIGALLLCHYVPTMELIRIRPNREVTQDLTGGFETPSFCVSGRLRAVATFHILERCNATLTRIRPRPLDRPTCLER